MANLTNEQKTGRAKNAVREYLTRTLLLPKIYFDANWNSNPVDLLAIDRDGFGDVYAVKLVHLKEGALVDNGERIYDCLQALKLIPTQYRSIAVVTDENYPARVNGEPYSRRYDPGEKIRAESLADDGIGRIGILDVDLTKEDATVQVVIKAERFRSSAEIITLTDEYVAQHTADWEVRA